MTIHIINSISLFSLFFQKSIFHLCVKMFFSTSFFSTFLLYTVNFELNITQIELKANFVIRYVESGNESLRSWINLCTFPFSVSGKFALLEEQPHQSIKLSSLPLPELISFRITTTTTASFLFIRILTGHCALPWICSGEPLGRLPGVSDSSCRFSCRNNCCQPATRAANNSYIANYEKQIRAKNDPPPLQAKLQTRA